MSLLSKRETDVLLLLGCYRYLGRSQVQEFLLSGTSTTALSREVIGKRILGGLRKRGLLGATKRLVGGPGGGSTRLGYYLTNQGVKLARSLNPDLPAKRPTSGGTFLLQHSLMTADVALAFRRAAAAHALHELLDWGCGWQAVARLGTDSVTPDARLVYGTADHEMEALVEIDLGTEGTRFFSGKIRRYVELFRSGQWQKLMVQWPVVITVTRSDARTTALKNCTESVLRSQPDHARLAMQTEFAFAALDEVVRDPLDIIWEVAGRTGRYALLDGRHLE